MSSTTFVDNSTVIYASWLNDVNNAVYNGIFPATSITIASINVTSLTASVAVFTDASKNLVSRSVTGTGNAVLATTPTLVSPVLGTPTSGTLTNCTGLPLTAVTGLGTGVATFLSIPTSVNLAAAVTDETGTGSLVFATSPTLVTPILGVAKATSLSTTAPVTKTTSFTLADSENWIIANGASANVTATLPAASSWVGRQVTIKNLSGTYTVISASSNVVPLNSSTAGTAILAATAGKWATLVSDGTNWIIMEAA